MCFLVIIKELSNGSIEKSITSYDSEDTGLRKFHEAFNVIGGGPKKITAILMKGYLYNTYNTLGAIEANIQEVVSTNYQMMILKNETWMETPVSIVESEEQN